MTYSAATLWQFLTWGCTSVVAGVVANTFTGSELFAWAAAILAAVLCVLSAFVIETSDDYPEDL